MTHSQLLYVMFTEYGQNGPKQTRYLVVFWYFGKWVGFKKPMLTKDLTCSNTGMVLKELTVHAKFEQHNFLH